MRNGKVLVFVLAALVAGAGCVGGSKGVSAEDKEKLKPYVLDAPPANATRIDINFENKVHIVATKVEPEIAKPGQEVKLTYYWRLDDRIDEGWKLFTHLHDDVADKSDNMDNVGAIRELRGDKQVLGPDKWEKGKIYVDEQTYKVPDWVKAPEITVMVGIWKQSARLRIIQGPNDGDNRAIVAKIKTGLTVEKKRPEPRGDLPQIQVNKLAAGEKITVDGKADEKAWAGAVATGPFVDVGAGGPNASFPVNGAGKLLWDDTNLYAFFEVSDPNVIGGFDKAKKPDDFTAAGQPKLWTKHCVELMIDPDGDGDMKDYYEIQINPQNLVFKSQFDTLQKPSGGPNGPFGHEEWDAKMKTAVVVKGTLDKEGDKDEGYHVEVAIPWASLSKAKKTPPAHGDTWKMNFYAMQDNGGVAWSPILGKGNFHHGPRFGRVTWVEPGKPLPAKDGEPQVAAGTVPGADGGALAAAGADGGAKTAASGDAGKGGAAVAAGGKANPATPVKAGEKLKK